MSEKTGILDETGQTISTPAQDVIEPLIQHIQERPYHIGRYHTRDRLRARQNPPMPHSKAMRRVPKYNGRVAVNR